MKKTTLLRAILLAFILIQSFGSIAQNGITAPDSDTFATSTLVENETNEVKSNLNLNDNVRNLFAFNPSENPVIRYAQLPFAGQVAICPDNNKELPKLFLCGGNDSRLIETGITNVQSITWQRFVSGGSCITVSNSDCANESASPSCWVQVATGPNYLANSAGQFRVIIVDALGTPFTHYFNVFQNSLIPTAASSTDIVTYGTGTCQIPGRITIGGFGSGYEYSFTTGSTPTTWQDSNVFSTNTPGNYTAFIRIRGVVGSCEFRVINNIINRTTFSTSTSIASPRCFGQQGSIQVSVNDVNQQYTYQLFNSANALVGSFGPTLNVTHTFTGLSAGSYRLVTSVVGTPCMVDTRTNVVVAAPPSAVTSSASITTALTACNAGRITVNRAGGTGPYRFFVNVNGVGFVEYPTRVLVIDQSGTYDIRVVDANGCAAPDIRVVVPAVDRPIYTINRSDGNCTGTLGQIQVNVSNFNGYTVEYSFNNGTNFGTVNTISNLLPGRYNVIVRYRKAGVNSGNFCTDPVEAVIIGPNIALTASAGVAELSGCGPPGNELQGRVRITNPQGGTPFPAPNLYRYSFDNRATWITSNEAFINPGGPYTFYIQDASGCEYAMGGIILDPKPAAPTITVSSPVFNCDGTGTTTVTVTNSGSTTNFSYDYFLDGILNTNIPSNVFINVPQGDHTLSVNYNVLNVPTYSVLLQEDFGRGGFTTTPGINPAYCFADEATTHLLPGYTCNPDQWINDGEYAVASAIRTNFSGVWVVANDHTLPDDPLGRFLCVNVGGTAGIGGILYSKPIRDVIPNQPVIISLWAQNLIRTNRTSFADPRLTIQLVNNLNGVGGTETIVATTPIASPWVIPKSERWEFRDLSLNPGAFTNLSFVIRSYSNEFNGNDVLIDDILVRQIPVSCNTLASFPLVVDGSRAFAASITGFRDVRCNGENNGEITFSARNFDPVRGFQYQVGTGPWITVIPSPAATTGSVTLTNLPSGIYNINIRYDDSANSCNFPQSQEIRNPDPVDITTNIVTLPTCTTGATIRAGASGGTPAYQYQLTEVVGGVETTIVPFNNNRDFTNVPVGDYRVYVRDANGCTDPDVVEVTVAAPLALTATLATTTDYCYTTANPATLVVNVEGGTGPFTYQLDTSAAVSSAATTYSFANVTPGTHTILVTDSNNCTATIDNIVIAPQLGFNVSLINDLTCLVDASIDTPVITGGNGTPYSYTVSRDSGIPTTVTFPYTATQAGSYVFTVTDSLGCTASSNAIIVTPRTTPTHTTVKTDITCNGLNNGTITVTPLDGFTTTYTYAIKLSTATTYTTQATNQFTSLAAGTYDIKVIDSKGCESAPTQVTIINPDPIVVTATATPFTCSLTNVPQSAVVTIDTPTGGTGTYLYSFNGGSFTSTNTLTVNNGTTTVNYQVRDANGCLSPLETITIQQLNSPTDLSFNNPPITCNLGSTTTTVTVTATNGVGTLQYETIAPSVAIVAKQTSNSFAGLLPGLYTFRVTDANGCYYTESYSIASVTPIAVTAVKLSDVACFGNNTGSARFTVTGFSSTGNYVITVSSTPASLPFPLSPTGDVRTLTNLVAGTYTFTVTDNTTGCIDSESITITQPTAVLSITAATATAVFCSNDNSQITITATGGTPSYGYAAVPNGAPAPTTFGTSNVVTVDTNNGTILSWDVYVRDANGCVTPVPFDVNIDDNGAPTVTAIVDEQCTASGSATGSVFPIGATATGGLAPYTYTINTGVAPSPGNIFTVAPGTYTITATDANGCPATTSVTVNQRLTALAAVTKDITCSLPPEATIRVTISGGIAPFTYRVRTVPGTYSGGPIAVTGNSFIYTAPGTTGESYEFEITDANGTPACVAISNVVTTNTPVTVTATEVHVDPTCNGFSDGSIRLTATAGEAPFTYSISGVSGLGSANVFGGLAAGSYNYIVRDAKGCDATGTIVLDDPAPINLSVSANPIQCNGNVPGSIDVTIDSGGVAPFTYTILNNTFTPIVSSGPISSTTYTFAGLAFGDYYINVVDANGCERQSIRTRIFTPPNIVATGNATTGTCATGAIVEITVNIGAPNFTYQIFGQPSTSFGPTAATSHIFPNLIHGTTYQFQVIDAGGCFTIVEVTTPPSPSTIAITGTTSTNVTCNGAANGSLAFTVENFDLTVTAINYEVLNALTLSPLPTPINGQLTGTAGGPFSGNITTLPAGNYVLRATEDSGTLCSASYTFTITQPAQPLASVVANTVNANCNSGALVTLTTTGGTGPYTYAAAVAPVVPTTGHIAGNVITLDPTLGTSWIIQVRDANGCTVNVPVTIAVDPSPVIALEIVNKCLAQGAFEIRVVEVTAGTGAYSISVDGSTFTSIAGLSHTVSGLNSGSHTIIIRDANGCTDTETILIDEPLVATPLITALPTCADNDGVITMTGTGGPIAGTYTYTISPTAPSVAINNATGVISGLPAGTYTITMTDTATPTACTTTAEVTLSAAIPVTFTTATTPALCEGDSNGTITVTLEAGNNNPSYTYEIIAGPQLAVAQSSNIFTGLQPGTYTVRVNSGRGCSTSDNTVVFAPATPLTATAAFPANASCSTSTVITVTAGGGTGSGYTYNFNSLGFTSVNTFTVNNGPLASNTTIVVRDANGCVTPLQSISTPAFNPPTNMDISGSLIYCAPATSTTSTVTINTVTNGVVPFTYQILSPASATTNTSGETSGIFDNLPSGDYMFQVTDANGCTYQELYTVAPRVNIAATVATITNETCFNTDYGTATFTVSNSAGYTATLTLGSGTPVVSGNTVTLSALAPGNYNLQVVDDITGCTADVLFTIAGIADDLDFSTTATNINCDVDTATITVSASGGTLNYQYAVVAVGGTPAPTAFGLSDQLTVDTSSGANMQWDVYVRDANGCEDFATVTIQTDANPTITDAVATQCPSATGKYEITVTASGVNVALEYSADGTNYQTGNVITVNGPGNYNITVRDANGCESIAFPVSILTPLIVNPVVSIPVSCAGNDGVVNVNATGGSGNYEYNIDGGGFAVVPAFNGVAAGIHTIGVRDTTTLCEVFVDVNLQAATAITGFALATTAVTCNGGNDGTIRATIATPATGVNDNPVYRYALTGTSITGAVVNRSSQDSPLFTGLVASISLGYIVTVTSGRGCVATESIVVTQPDLIVVPDIDVVQFGCTSANIDNLATITVDAATIFGGSGMYLNYEFVRNGSRVQFSTSNVYSEANLAGGSYTINVFDDLGCVGTAAATINPFIGIDFASPAAVTVTQSITCTNTEDIQVNATFTGGSPVMLDYTIEATPSNVIPYLSVTNNSGQFTNLTVGSYTITVVNPATGCAIRTIYIVNEPNTFSLVASNINDVRCRSTNSGSAVITFVDNQLNPTNDAGTFNYSVTGPGGVTTGVSAGPVLSLTNLAAGFYTVSGTLQATPFCTVVTSFTIEEPITALTLAVATTPISCVPGNDGTITATGDGGWPGSYQYELVGVTPGAISVPLSYQFVFENLTPGTYNVNVYDTRGCVATVSVVLNNPTPIIFTAAAAVPLLTCNGDDNGEIVVSLPTGGQGSNYSYILNHLSADPVFATAPQTSPIFSGLVAGNYTVTVIDALGCISTPSAVITINEPAAVAASLVLASGITCDTDATVTLSATGGTGAYEYSAVPSFVPVLGSFASSVTFSVPVGDHQYYVRDANNCISVISNTISVAALEDLIFAALDVTMVLCRGDNSGVIAAVAQGGLGNYSYTLLDGAGNPLAVVPTQTTPGYFTGLVAGSYLVRVVSGDCEEQTLTPIVITEPLLSLTESSAPLNVTCAGERNGSITITASGGTGIIKYAISPRLDQFFESNVFLNLLPGSYDYIVQDANGCFIYRTGIVITEPNSVIATVIPNSDIPEVCAGDANGAFSLNITGGNAPYSVSLNNRTGTYTTGALTQTQFDFTGLSGSEHMVYIRDANGCESDITILLGEPVTLNPVARVSYDCVSNSQVNAVTITIDASNNAADVDYALDGAAVYQASNVFNNLSAGTHTVDVRHSNGCIKQVIFDVDQVNEITIALSDGGLNEIVTTVTGGFGNYQYSLNGEPQGSLSNFIIYSSGVYTVTVTDANGCSATASRFFTFIDIKLPNAFTPNGDGNNDTWAPTNTINYEDLIFEVFDRYGRKLGTFREGESWDGRYNGTELPSGDYWYILRLKDVKDPREFVGHFTLYR